MLPGAGPGRAHRLDHPQRAQLAGHPQQLGFTRTLDESQLVQDGREITDLRRGAALAQQPDEPAHPIRPAIPRIREDLPLRVLQGVPAHHGAFRHPQRRVEHSRPIEKSAQLLDAMHRVHAGQGTRRISVVRREELALVLLALLRLMRQEQRARLRAAIEQQVGVGRLDAAEVVEVVRLPEKVVAALLLRALDQSHRIAADGVEHAPAPAGELVRGEVFLEHGGFPLTGTASTHPTRARARRTRPAARMSPAHHPCGQAGRSSACSAWARRWSC